MTWRRLPALALIVAALVAVVAVLANGPPLAARAGRRWPPGVVLGPAITRARTHSPRTRLARRAAIALTSKPETTRARPFHLRRVPAQPGGDHRSRAFLAFFSTHLLSHLHHFRQPLPPAGSGHHPGVKKPRRPVPGATSPHFLWTEVAVVAGLLVLLGAIFMSTSPRRPWKGSRTAPAGSRPRSTSRSTTCAPIPTYAARSSPRTRAWRRRSPRPASPRPGRGSSEYVERALLSLDTSGTSVRRLTDLFEWARFSQHEPEPWMRDEAVEALKPSATSCARRSRWRREECPALAPSLAGATVVLIVLLAVPPALVLALACDLGRAAHGDRAPRARPGVPRTAHGSRVRCGAPQAGQGARASAFAAMERDSTSPRDGRSRPPQAPPLLRASADARLSTRHGIERERAPRCGAAAAR